MKLDDLINTLFKDVVQPPSIDANSPGEMVRAQLAGQMPGMTPRAPMALSGRAAVGAMAPPNGRAVDVVRYQDNPDGTTTNFLSDGSKSVVNYSNAGPGQLKATEVGGTPSPAPIPEPSGFEDFMQGAAGNDLISGIIGGFVNTTIAPERRKREAALKAQQEAQARATANQTVQALIAAGAPPQIAQATVGNPLLMKQAIDTYIRPAADPLARRKLEAEVAKLEREAKGGFDQSAWTDGAGVGKRWVDPNDRTKGVVDLPGAEKPVKPPTAIQTEAGKADMAYNSLMPAIDAYVNTVRKYGAEAMPGPGKDLMGQQLRDIQLQLKELYNLGVLNGPDLALMEQMLFDPRIGFNPMDWPNAYGAVERTEKSADELKRILTRIRDTKVQQAGGEAAAPQQSSPQAAGGVRPVTITGDEHYNQLPSGTRFIDPEGNERVKP